MRPEFAPPGFEQEQSLFFRLVRNGQDKETGTFFQAARIAQRLQLNGVESCLLQYLFSARRMKEKDAQISGPFRQAAGEVLRMSWFHPISSLAEKAGSTFQQVTDFYRKSAQGLIDCVPSLKALNYPLHRASVLLAIVYEQEYETKKERHETLANTIYTIRERVLPPREITSP
ncbi:MAG: hypothetical protein ABIB61_00845 [Candidatus Shapirobacteria bacterium]